jgi:hypothetical protein
VTFETLIKLPAAWTVLSGRFGVHLFEGHLTVADMDQMQAKADAWHDDNPGRIVELVVVFPSRTIMSGEERRRMTQLIKRWEKLRDASSTVILAEGMVGAMQRSVLTGMLMLVPPPHPSRVHRSVDEAVRFLYPYLGSLCPRATSEDVLRGAVQKLCTEFRARPASA